MDADSSKNSIELDTTGEDIVTDSLADILSSSDSSLTSLTSDNLLQHMTTEDETLKTNEISETETNISEQSTKESFNSQLPNVNTQNWYLHPLFQRYWKHYAHAMAWCQNHQIVTHKLQQNGHPVYQRHSQPYSRNCVSNKNRGNLKTSKQPMFKMPKLQNENKLTRSKKNEKKQYNVSFSEESTACEDTHLSDADSEVYEMEITEEMADFFAQSQKHRKERGTIHTSMFTKLIM